MGSKILYFGEDSDVFQSLFHTAINGCVPDIFATTRLDAAVDELMDSDFDYCLIDEPDDDADLELLLRVASILDTNVPILCRHRRAVNEQVDGSDQQVIEFSPDDPITSTTLEHVTNEVDTPVIDEIHPILESLQAGRPHRSIAHVDREGIYLWANERMSRLIDVDPTDLVGESITDVGPKTTTPGLASLVKKAIDSGDLQWTGGKPEGSDQLYCICPLEDGTALIITHTPEATLAFGGKYLDRLAELFFIVDFSGELIYWNDSVNEVTGYTDAELFELNAIEMFATEDQALAAEKLNAVSSHEAQSVELSLVTKDGESIPYQFSGSLIERGDGTPRYVCGIGRDISQRVEMRRELNEAIDKLEASNDELERFAYVASHDLREPLRMVRSYLELLQRRYEDSLDDEAKEFVEFAVDGAERMKAMIEDLLEYSRVGSEIREERVDCNSILENVRNHLRVSIEESGAVIIANELPTVTGDRTLLLQLFQNILANAIEHRSDDPPKIHVKAARQEDLWAFSVRDNSGGLDGVDEEEAFQLFSSGTNGTGIGLATCRKIVEMFDGEISVETESGVGSTFHFTLPAADPR